MKQSKFSEEQVAYALRQAESGTPVGDVCRQLGVSEATFYVWKKRFGHLGVNEVRRVRQLEEENSRLKRLVADLTLDKHMLAEALRKKSEALTSPRARRVVHGNVPDRLSPGVRASAVWPDELVPAEQGSRPDGTADEDPRAGARETTVWLRADLGAATTRGLDRKPKAGETVVPPAGPSATDAGAATKALRAAPRTCIDSNWACGTLEHGFRPRCACRRSPISCAHRRRSVESSESDP